MIYLTGDTHGSAYSRLKTCGLGTSDYIIILGDFGCIWNDSPSEKLQLKWLEEQPWTTLFVDGNHENFELLNALPIAKKFDGEVGVVNPSVLHLRRGQVYSLEGQKLFVMGGASSIDRACRTPGLSWWPEENITLEEYNLAVKNLKKHKSIDYVLTHRHPNGLYPNDVMFQCPSGYLLKELLELHIPKFKHWYFAHMHEDRSLNEQFTCLFRQIIPLGGVAASNDAAGLSTR
jgi:hypothetical protein